MYNGFFEMKQFGIPETLIEETLMRVWKRGFSHFRK